MIKRLLACWAILAVLFAGTAAGKNEPKYDAVISAFTFEGTDTTVTWEECGQINAFYNIAEHEVVMCTELLTYDIDPVLRAGFIRFVLAHELAHGVIRQLGVAFTGSEEDAADELAIYVLAAMDQEGDIEAFAEVLSLWEDGEQAPWDEHTIPSRRAYKAACYANAAKGEALDGGTCDLKFRRLVSSWNRLLEASLPATGRTTN